MAHHTNTTNILKQHRLRLTNCRKQVLSYMLEVQQAVGQPTLERQMSDFDRVTLYRTLNTFLEKGIIHKVLDDTGVTKYALCASGCTKHQHNDEHVHFKCNECGKLECINTIGIPNIKLPQGYLFNDANLLVRGTCKDCVM